MQDKRRQIARKHVAATNVIACEQENFIENFVAAACCTKSNWFDFVRHVAATKFCRGDKILINLPPNVEAFTTGDLSLQPIAAISAYDLSLDCTHKAICCSNMLLRLVTPCVPAFMTTRKYKRACENKGKHSTINYRDAKHLNKDAFIVGLKNAPWDSASVFDDTNDIVFAWYEIFNDVVNEYLSLKQKRVKRNAQPKWF